MKSGCKATCRIDTYILKRELFSRIPKVCFYFVRVSFFNKIWRIRNFLIK